MPSTIKFQAPSYSLLSSPQEEISRDSSKDTRRERSLFLKIKSGGWPSRWSTGWGSSIEWIFSTEISKVPTFFSPTRTNRSNLGTSMSAKSAKVDLLALKQEHHTTLALKFGQICLTMENATFGPWDAFFMRWPHLDHLSWRMTFKGWERRSLLDISSEFLPSILKNWKIWSDYAWPSIQRKDQVLKVYFTTTSFAKSFTFTQMSTSTRWNTKKWTKRTD